MTIPKFSVGEVVVLQSTHHPEYNGEYQVFRIANPGEVHQCRITGQSHLLGELEKAYILDTPLLAKITGREAFWKECALRKKHDGCGQSFQQLLTCLNTNVKEKA